MLFVAVCVVAVAVAAGAIGGVNQVHLALGELENSVVVTWSTPTQDDITEVIYGRAAVFPKEARTALGTETKFVDNGTLHHTQFIHRTTLGYLAPLTEYTYQIRNGTVWTQAFNFRSPGGRDWAPVFTVFGDFGLTNAVALPALKRETAARVSDVIVHAGDFAYDMWVDNATFGDTWFNSVESVYANVPVMVCPGNHEGLYDFLNYRMRFSMPMWNVSENLFFSWDAGMTHWVAYDTEVYFVYDATSGHGGVGRNFGPYPDVAKAQLAFVEADLRAANARRHERPWIIAYGHRPMYCSDDDDDDCTQMRDEWRHGLEDLFYKYGVDIIFEAHQHSYERLWPTYNLTVLNGTTVPGKPYVNPRAPVHIVAGAAGCQEDLDPFGPPLGPWSAVRISQYGYGHLRVANATHVQWEQLHATSGAVLDSVWIVRDGHKPYADQK